MIPVLTALSTLSPGTSTNTQPSSVTNHLRYPVSLLPFLLHAIEKDLRRQFRFLALKKVSLKKIRLKLFCEYDEKRHLLEVSTPHYQIDFDDYVELLENQLHKLDLGNAVTRYEMELVTTAGATSARRSLHKTF